MKILDRYVLLEFIRYFFAILIVLALIFFVAEFLRGESETTAIKLFIYNAYNLPATLVQMTAPAAMLATMITLSMLNRKNELVAMQACGIGIFHIAFLLFGTVFILCCTTLVISDRVLPPLAKKRTAFLWREIKGRKDFSLDIKSSKIWYRSKNYIYNLKTYDRATATIYGFGIYLFDENFSLKQQIEAKEAHYLNGEWNLKSGIVSVFASPKEFPLVKKFSDKKMVLPDKPENFSEIERQVDTLRLKDLWMFIKRNKISGLKTDGYEVDFHSRVSLSFIPMVMSLLVIPYAIRPRRQGGFARDISICIGWILVYWIMMSISMSLGRSGTTKPWLAVWFPSVLFLAAAVVQILRK